MHALSSTPYRILAIVASAPDGVRAGDLARLSSSRPQAATRITQRLEAQGLVWSEQGAKKADRRAVIVRLTEANERAWSEISKRRRELTRAALEGVELPPGTEAGLEAIARAIEQYSA